MVLVNLTKQMAKPDYYEYLGSRDQQKGSTAVKHLNDLGYMHIESIVLDRTNSQPIKQARLGLESKIDVLVILINNAGIGGTQFSTIIARPYKRFVRL